jgi:hypothetical protein
MASAGRTTEQVRREIETEREQLAAAVEELHEATALTNKLGANLPVVAAGALGTGFVLAGGVGATVRLLFRRSREGTKKARVGRFTLIDRN